jgi:hypothetical protein
LNNPKIGIGNHPDNNGYKHQKEDNQKLTSTINSAKWTKQTTNPLLESEDFDRSASS